MRGGIIDIFPSGEADPVRLDLFGDTIESIRRFDPATQRSTEKRGPISRCGRSPKCRSIPTASRVSAPAGASCSARALPPTRSTRPSPKAAAIPAWNTGCRCSTTSMETLLDYLPNASVIARPAVRRRADRPAGNDRRPLRRPPHGAARRRSAATARCRPSGCIWTAPAGMRCWRDRPALAVQPIRPARRRAGHRCGRPPRRGVHPIAAPACRQQRVQAACARRPTRWSAAEAPHRGRRLDARLARAHRRICCVSTASRAEPAEDWAAVQTQPARTHRRSSRSASNAASSPRTSPSSASRICSANASAGPPRKRKRADQFIAEATEIAEGDLVVHQDYGIGRYDGLETLTRRQRAA